MIYVYIYICMYVYIDTHVLNVCICNMYAEKCMYTFACLYTPIQCFDGLSLCEIGFRARVLGLSFDLGT